MSKFMIVSNARCGSTHLVTSLQELPDVSADGEFIFSNTYVPGEYHTPLTGKIMRVAPILDCLPDAKIKGSKLILDYMKSFPMSRCDEFFRYFDKNIRIVHVLRSYYDVFLSYFLRGAIHVVNRVPESASNMSDLIQKNNDESLRVEQKNASTVQVDLPKALKNLIYMFVNDMVLVELSRKANHSMQIKYENINSNFSDVGKFVGSDASEEQMREIIEDPILRKLKKIDDKVLQEDALRYMSAKLEQVRDAAIKQKIPLKDVVTAKSGDGSLTLHVSSLVVAMQEAINMGKKVS